MKVHMRDRFAALLGIGLLVLLIGASYYYAVRTDMSTYKSQTHAGSPDFVARDLVVTEFEADGTAKRRLFAEYAEHFNDGRMNSVKPRMVTLRADEPQLKAVADTGVSTDNGQSILFSGNVHVTRAGDKEHAPMSFTTTHVTVFPDTNRLETDAPVRMVSGSDVTTGVGMTMDHVDRTVQIHNNVRTSVIPRN